MSRYTTAENRFGSTKAGNFMNVITKARVYECRVLSTYTNKLRPITWSWMSLLSLYGDSQCYTAKIIPKCDVQKQHGRCSKVGSNKSGIHTGHTSTSKKQCSPITSCTCGWAANSQPFWCKDRSIRWCRGHADRIMLLCLAKDHAKLGQSCPIIDVYWTWLKAETTLRDDTLWQSLKTSNRW